MLIFSNPGLIDMAAALTMGVSIKETESPIGRFGTGFKFAIATILRNGGRVMVWRDGKAHEFGIEQTEIRGQKFDMVCMNGRPLGFTTMLGRDWLPWMAFRELASNARDEGGTYLHTTGTGKICDSHLAGHTHICVTGLDDVWPERGTIMLESEPLASNEHGEIHAGASPYVFFRGVRIFTAPRPMLFTYNLASGITLTEDRQAANWWQVEHQIEKLIGKLEDESLLRKIITAPPSSQEHHVNVGAYGSPGAAFREAARELTMGKGGARVAPAVASFARASAIEDLKPGDSIKLEPVELLMLQRAKWMLHTSGIEIDDFPIIICDTLGPAIGGLARDGKIFLARKAFDKGTRELAATLFEEWAHLVSGAGDETRALQDFLIDRLLMQIERCQSEPF
jgi:hypothetical protein